MKHASAHLLWVMLLGGCGFDIPSGVYECAAVSDCPTDFECEEGLCVRGVPCPALDAPEDGAVAPAGPVYPGLTATYSCDEVRGFVLEDASLATRRCGDDSRWEGAQPRCVWGGCPSLPPPAHGSIDVTDAPSPGDEAIYACESLYSLQGNEGERTRVCIDGLGWSGEDLICAPNHGYATWPLPGWAGEYQSSDVTVSDATTGLIWQRAVEDDTHAWAEAVAYCDALTLAGRSDWRLPTRMELLSIVDYSSHGPAIDPDVFPSTPPTLFWTSSSFDANEAWAIHFANGVVAPGAKSTSELHRVRCVR